MKKKILAALFAAGMVIIGQITVSGAEAVSGNTIYISDEALSTETSNEEYSIPVSYDARKFGYVTPLKQQDGGKCLTYATIAAMESNLLKKGIKDVDLSEKHLWHFMMNKVYDPLGNASGDYTKYKTDGSYFMNMIKALSNGFGPVNESRTDAYTFDDMPEELAYIQDYSVKHIYEVPTNNKDKVKQMIMEYGGGAAKFYAGDDYKPDAVSEYAYYTDGNNSPNHAIEIIGWDDSYSKNNFTKKPSSDGAWLVKDSHGSFVWLSYENKSLCSDVLSIYFIDLECSSPRNNYHYDNTTYRINFKSDGIYMIAFSSHALDKEQITSIGFGNATYASQCVVTVYKNPVIDNGKIISFEDISEETFNDILAGYHVFDLSKLVTVENGDMFYASFSFPKDTYISATNRVEKETYTSYNETAPGRYFTGFRQSDGAVTYKDLYNSNSDLELCLKVMTTGEIIPVETPAPYSPPVTATKEKTEIAETPVLEQHTSEEENIGWNGRPVKNEKKRLGEGTLVLYKKYIYKVKKDGSVEFRGTKKNIRKKIIVPDVIKVDGFEYPVTSISKNAITNNAKVQSIEIGKNVKSIGKKAFYGCKKLTSVKFKTLVLKKVGKDAFAGSAKKVKAFVPKVCKKAYKKLGIRKSLMKGTR